MMISVFLLLLLIAVATSQQTTGLKDDNENCEFWASIGECKKNPRYMLSSCSLSCSNFQKKPVELPKSFYDIKEKDIHGNEVSFDRFKGKVVYVVNVASQCGYTEENYRTFRQLQKYYEDGLEIVLAPCNAFGSQEPGGAEEIYSFASRKGFSGIILEKDEVNGDAARVTFQYLKHATGKQNISWYVWILVFAFSNKELNPFLLLKTGILMASLSSIAMAMLTSQKTIWRSSLRHYLARRHLNYNFPIL